MGRYCRICGRIRHNEKFSGKGHKTHICKECARKPKGAIEAIEQGDEILGFLEQSHISKKNISRLKILSRSANKEISEIAKLVFEVSRIAPYKKRRFRILSEKRKELLQKLIDSGLIFSYNNDDMTDYYEDITNYDGITDNFNSIMDYYGDKGDNYGDVTDNYDNITDYCDYFTDENSR